MSSDLHFSVLLEQSIDLLGINPDGVYIDCTFGRGGHSQAILARLSQSGKLIAFDKDLTAIDFAKTINDPRFTIVHSGFANLKAMLAQMDITQVDGILADLGLSSPQLDDPLRGFSFRADARLDMRMNQQQQYSAYEFVNNEEEELIANTIFKFGEDKFARRIASNIVKKRQIKPITSTLELSEIVRASIPAKLQDKNPAIRTFQAIRIYVNNELAEIEQMLSDGLSMLKPAGRMVVISFHSLEDKIVKSVFNEYSSAEVLPKWVMKNPTPAKFKLITKKIKANELELLENNRSRSAVLRGIEKC